MDLEALETSERELVGQCLRACVAGPFFPDWEFSTIFGLEREEVRAIATAGPTTGDRALTELAINNALNYLVGYPHGCDGVWSQWISASPTTLIRLLSKVRGASPGNYFEGLR
jgi:hypothetical protein